MSRKTECVKSSDAKCNCYFIEGESKILLPCSNFSFCECAIIKGHERTYKGQIYCTNCYYYTKRKEYLPFRYPKFYFN